MAWGKTVGVASWVERLKANDPSLTSVTVFRGRLFGASEAAEVCAALRTNAHLAELYASGHAVDAATAALFAEALAVNASLRSLCIGDDAFGDAGLVALAPGVAASASLAALDLEHKGVGDAGASALGAALAARSDAAPLLDLNLARNPAMTPAGMAAVCVGAAKSARVRALDLREARVDAAATAAIAALVAAPGASLAALDLSDAVGADGALVARALGEGLRARDADASAAPLESLALRGVEGLDVAALCAAAGGAIRVARADLRACGLGPDPAAVGALVAAAARGGRCAALLLGENALGDAGVVAVADALAKDAGAIVTLDLGRCRCGAGGAAALARGGAGRTLRELSLFGNDAIDDDALGAVVERGGEMVALRTLDVGGCGVSEVGLVAAKDALASDPGLFPSLETLVVGGNPGAGGDAWEAAVEALRTARPGLDVAWRAADAGEAEKAKERGAFAEAK